MSFNLDTVIFVSFLAANLIFGLMSSRGIKNIKEYAIGDRKFSTATIVTTIVATWITGSMFYNAINETYINGISYLLVASIGDPLCLILMALVFIPRMGEFLGKLSVEFDSLLFKVG